MSETNKKDYINGPCGKVTRARVPLSHCPKKQESEKTLEARLRKEIEQRGGMAIKLMSQLHRGLPDRMIIMPQGCIYFVELKSTGEKPTGLQTHCHNQLRNLGHTVYVIDTTQRLQDFLFILDVEQLEKVNSPRR